jgi:hypothetical protein
MTVFWIGGLATRSRPLSFRALDYGLPYQLMHAARGLRFGDIARCHWVTDVWDHWHVGPTRQWLNGTENGTEQWHWIWVRRAPSWLALARILHCTCGAAFNLSPLSSSAAGRWVPPLPFLRWSKTRHATTNFEPCRYSMNAGVVTCLWSRNDGWQGTARILDRA